MRVKLDLHPKIARKDAGTSCELSNCRVEIMHESNIKATEIIAKQTVINNDLIREQS